MLWQRPIFGFNRNYNPIEFSFTLSEGVDERRVVWGRNDDCSAVLDLFTQTGDGQYGQLLKY